MTDDVRDIPPALSESEWAKRSRRNKPLEFSIFRDSGNVLSIGDDAVDTMASATVRDVSDLAALIALANAALPDEDPRKFTWETVAALRAVAEIARREIFSEAQRLQVESVDDLADVLESYLPPGAP